MLDLLERLDLRGEIGVVGRYFHDSVKAGAGALQDIVEPPERAIVGCLLVGHSFAGPQSRDDARKPDSFAVDDRVGITPLLQLLPTLRAHGNDDIFRVPGVGRFLWRCCGSDQGGQDRHGLILRGRRELIGCASNSRFGKRCGIP